MFVAASFKHEMENLVPAWITCAAATAPDVRRKVSLPPCLGAGVVGEQTSRWISAAWRRAQAQQPSTGRDAGPAAAQAGATPGSAAGAWHVGEAGRALGEQCKSRTNADSREDPKLGRIYLENRLKVSG